MDKQDKLFSVVILAAGNGTRMKSKLAKVLHELNGSPLVAYSISLASSLDHQSIVTVIQPGQASLMPYQASVSVEYAVQKEQLGTGHAVSCGLESINSCHDILVLCGDMPLLRIGTLKRFLFAIGRGRSAVLTSTFSNPFGYGRIVRGSNGELLKIIEEKDADEEKKINEINSGVMYLNAEMIQDTIGDIQANNSQNEHYLTDIIEIAIRKGHKFEAINIADEDEVLGINSKKDLAVAESIIRKRHADLLLDQGVTLIDPSRIDIRGELKVGKDVTLDVGVIIEGSVELGDNVRVGAYTIIKDSSIADNTQILSHSVIEGAVIASHCTVGPFARIRPGTKLEENVKVGNFVEVKKTSMGKGSKANHLSYLGDAEIGTGSNIGAGSITCNYDGKDKHKTVIGDNSFIGTNSSLVAPVKIGDGAFIAAGSVITKNVPDHSLGLARARQDNKTNWTKKKD